MGMVCLLLLGLSAALVCPDGGMCAERNTCCRNNQGGYSCCPLPHAECCSDHLHCCYEGTVCDLLHEKCVNKTVSLSWMSRLPTKQVHPVSQVRTGVNAVVCPDQQSECPDDTTCCQLPDSSWGCCPLAKAVCCEDKRHCCPEGTTCDIPHSKCLSDTQQSFPMLPKLPARSIQKGPGISASVTCPGGKSTCPEGYTCCQLASGDYGCCPYTDATCCSDHLHCCPSNTVCDLEHLSCKSGDEHEELMKEIPAALSDIVCPDQESVCPHQTTCCQLTNGTYSCCPMPNAVCCKDHIHCCPASTTCDVPHSTCMTVQENPPSSIKMLAAALTGRSEVREVPCNDSVACADRSTCCKTSEGEWACCPLPKAVCCEDHLHCCPHGTICNLEASTCDSMLDGATGPLLSKSPAFPRLQDNSKCDRSTSCPGKATCCKTASGDWACCPLPQAVCCDDHTHCCPHATICNLEAETCDDPSGHAQPVPWQAKHPALTQELPDEICDEQTRCPGGTTCCKKNSGQWACCPLPQAVCCSDQEHCCPKGYRCNVSAQTCDKTTDPSMQKKASLVVPTLTRSDKNMCDAQTSCPRDTTCCFMETSKKWGCCPLPKAVCCKDGNHCCPSDHTCEPHRSSCSRGPYAIPWFTKLSAQAEPATVTDVKCDDKSSCASGTTCCKLPTGEWGCCPLVKAVCCADHKHCCPQGYTCNMQTETCEKSGMDQLPLSKVVQSKPREAEEDVQCDGAGNFRCPRHNTCCKISPTEWSCCPSPGAVCCSEFKHCCPAGYSCEPDAAGCVLTWDSLLKDRKKLSVPGGL